jgi:hypothetical protein
MPRTCATSRALQGPVKFLADHPAARALSLAGAGSAVGIFVARAGRSRGTRRIAWTVLALLELFVFAGILGVRREHCS